MVRWVTRHPIVGGALLGLTWGVVIRIWMRFISTDPEFTWEQTSRLAEFSAAIGV